MYKKLIEQFQTLLQKEELQRKERRNRGEDFNIFSVMRMQSDEVYTHSALIAELLNPQGSHGCGDIFLKILIEQNPTIFPVGFNTTNAKTKVELEIGEIKDDEGGRIDLVIEFGSQAIIIENKIYAYDQKFQLLRYYNYANRRYGKENYRLLYLTLDGKLPSADSIENKNIKLAENEDFYCISYAGEIKRWLEVCLKEAVMKPMLREVILQYLNLIKKLTHTEDMKTELKEEFLKLCDNPHNISTMISISENLPALIQHIMEKKIVPQLQEIAKTNGFRCEIKNNGKDWLDTSYMCFFFRKSNWHNFEICFEFQARNMRDIVSGFRYQDSQNDTAAETYKKLTELNISSQKQSKRWPCFHYLPSLYRNWISESAIDKIYDGTLIKEIEKELLALAEAAEKLQISL